MTHLTAPNPEQHLGRFGLSAFRRGQRDVISAILAGQDCLCIMPTGGGKSLCYQLPAVARPGVTLVVSPLIALMKDQVDALTAIGVRATFINSSLSFSEQQSRLENMAAGHYHLVYVAPERLRNPRFLEAIRLVRIQLLAVDEAHCISEWGHDFRPDYARLGRFRQRLGSPQTIALTATATPEVRQDVVVQLSLREPQIFVTGFARENLNFEVQKVNNGRQKDEALLEFLREMPGAGIVYASTRKRVEEVKTLIEQELKRSVGLYHAGLLPEDRHRVQEQFMQDRLQIIVATNAFGMGIDKRDLRFVVHYNLPGSLEAYYQEAGRAGRDGLPSRCLLLFTYQDRYLQEFFIENSYPARDVVAIVYEYLRAQPEDPIEITLEDLKERLELPIGSEGVGACERLLEKCGALERLDSMENMAAVRIDSDLPTLVEFLPREAKVQRRVLLKVEQEVGDRRYERVYFHPQRIAAAAEVDKDSVLRALRELTRLEAFDYVPAFRGRAVHLLARDKEFDELDIDFAELDQRRQREYEKLDRVIRYGDSRRCRQLEILEYFGDPDRQACGRCDNCQTRQACGTGTPATVSEAAASEAVVQAIRKALAGVARAKGRFGKNLVAQMLCGSKSSKVSKFHLDELSTFGLLSQLTQEEVVDLLDALRAAGLVELREIDRNRPLISLTDPGGDVMRGKSPVPAGLHLPQTLVDKLGGRPVSRAAVPDHELDEEPLPSADPRLVKELRQWRRETAEAAGFPPFRIFSNATLERLAATRPSSLGQLLLIKGIGPVTVQNYGDQLLAILARHPATRPAVPAPAPPPPLGPSPAEQAPGAIGEAAEPWPASSLPRAADRPRFVESPADVPPAASPLPQSAQESGRPSAPDSPPTWPALRALLPAAALAFEKRQAKPAFYWTWRLLWDGYTAAQCSEIRQLDSAAVLTHALQAQEQGLPGRLDWFLTAEQQQQLAQLVGDGTPHRLRPLLDQLPPGLGYDHVQLYLRCRAPRS